MEGTEKPRLLGWSIVYIVLLLSILPLGLITGMLLMVPVLVMYTRLGAKPFAAHYIISLAAVYLVSTLLLAGWVGALLVSVSLFLLPPVIQMGNLYKKRAPARTVLTVGVITLLAELLLSLVVSHAFGLNPVGKLRQTMNESFGVLLPQISGVMDLDPDSLVSLAVQLLPLYMIGFSIIYIVLTHVLARRALVRAGVQIPAFKPVREWMLPRSFVLLYVVTLVMEMFMRDSQSIFFALPLNLWPLLTAAFAVQAIAFLFYLAHANGWGKFLPVAGIVVLVVIPPAYFIFSLLGVLDVAFPIRERITRK